MGSSLPSVIPEQAREAARRAPGDLCRTPGGVGPGLQGVAEPPGGSPAAKSQVGIRRWSRGAWYPVPNVYPAPQLGAGKGGGDEDPIRAATAGSSGGGGEMGMQSLSQASLGCSGRSSSRASAASLFIVVEPAAFLPVPSLAPARPLAPILPPTRRKKSQSVEANES